MVKLLDKEEVTECVCSELHVVSLCSVLVLGRIRRIGDTKEDMKGGLLPAVAWIGSVSEIGALDDHWLT